MRTKRAAVQRSVMFGCAMLAMSASAPAAVAAAGGGGHRPANDCVTLQEYDKAHEPMTRKAVHNIFDTSGVRTSVTQSGSRTDEVRSYVVCKSPDSTVTVSYTKRGQNPFRFTSKSAVFV
jgi:hypothetical protein